MDTLEQRLADLEVRLTFIDDAVQALVDADGERSLRMAGLERLVHDLRTELASLRLSQSDDPRSEPPPPHY
ncbi:SlyX family protein [Dyella sp. A6]|uniref:SlyX family protein n=1 Tax=Dyella aluminiiresistens TaxID=3069105 RepID=UPI002E79D6D5|nr:SlyX family protein [Dyella sp. A6]